MKKDEDKNKKFINDTLAKSKSLTQSANNFLKQNIIYQILKTPNFHKTPPNQIKKNYIQIKKKEKQ